MDVWTQAIEQFADQWNVPGAAAAIAVPAILVLALLGTVFAGDIADGLVALSS